MESSGEPEKFSPGWYTFPRGGGVRFFDGEQWTDHFYPPPPDTGGPSFGEIVGGTFIGVLLALFVVYLGAQVSPDEVYLPVKFVVEELPELPNFRQ
jgi:hypothetical protein